MNMFIQGVRIAILAEPYHLPILGRRLLFLPAYSPDFNPAECVFSFIKSWLRLRAEYVETSPSLTDPIREAISNITPAMAQAWISHCCYV